MDDLLANNYVFNTEVLKQFLTNAKKYKYNLNNTFDFFNDSDYNFRDYFKEDRNLNPSVNGHYTDRFKTYTHPTFSDESKYSEIKSENNPNGVVGGHWDKDNYLTRNQYLLSRQAYAESTFNDKSKSKSNAVGLFGIKQSAINELNKRYKTNYVLNDAYDKNKGLEIRNRYVDWLNSTSLINNKNNKNDRVRELKLYLAYNAGYGTISKELERLKNNGVDIYNEDFINHIDTTKSRLNEAKRYADFIVNESNYIVNGKNTYTTEEYEKTKKNNDNYKFIIDNSFKNGGYYKQQYNTKIY